MNLKKINIKVFVALVMAVSVLSLSSCRNKAEEEVSVEGESVGYHSVEYPLGFCLDSLRCVEGKVKSGQFFSNLLGSLGMSAQEVYNLTQSCASVFDVKTLRVGQQYRAYYGCKEGESDQRCLR